MCVHPLTADVIAAANSKEFIVGMIDGLRSVLKRRELIAESSHVGVQYISELRALYEARIAVYVEALVILHTIYAD